MLGHALSNVKYEQRSGFRWLERYSVQLDAI